MKKSLKLLLISIFAFLFTTLSANAKTMTYDEFIKELDKYDTSIKEVYIIGKYAFTDINPLTTQDIMFASRSIDPQILGGTKKDSTFSKMIISYMSRKRTGMTYSDWTIGNPVVGTGGINKDSTFEIDYIDYNFVKEDSKIDNISETITNYQDKLTMPSFNNDSYNEDLTITSTDKVNYEAKGLLLYKKDANITGLEGNKTGYYMAFALNIPDLKSESTLTIKDVDEGGYSKTFSSVDYKTDSDKGTAIIWPVNPNSQSKKIEITLDIDGEEGLYGETKYYITWDEELQFQGESKLKIEMPNDNDETLIKNKFNYSNMWLIRFF